MTLEQVSVVIDHSSLTCDLCGSPHIIETTSGYVCGDCAVELKVKKLQYDRPYDDHTVQYARGLGKTQIGNKRERATSPNFIKLRRLNKETLQETNVEAIKRKAQMETSRILEYLGLGKTFEKYILEKFDAVRPQIQPGSKFRNTKRLVAVLTYLSLKVENVIVDKAQLLSVACIEEKEFNAFLTQAARHLPEYTKRNRQEYISKKLFEVTQHFGLDMAFYFLSRKILYKLWESIKNTTDAVVTGLCTSITALCNYRDEVRINSICELLNIKMSTIQFQVKRRIFERFNIPGFSSLVRSAELIKGFIKKIGLIVEDDTELKVVREEEGIVEVELGNARHIFNPANEYYLFSTLDEHDTIIVAYLEVHKTPTGEKFTKRSQQNLVSWLDLTIGEYSIGKGPPP
ncbi:MAG: hypothetical protein ACFFE4_01640 [Candidatus Thorarchaeota archaeon]